MSDESKLLLCVFGLVACAVFSLSEEFGGALRGGDDGGDSGSDGGSDGGGDTGLSTSCGALSADVAPCLKTKSLALLDLSLNANF